MLVTATSTVSASILAVYNRVLLERAVPMLCHDKFGKISPLGLKGGRGGAGKSMSWRIMNSLGAADIPLVEGVSGAGSQLSVADVTAEVKQYGDYVTLTDLLLMTEIDPILVEVAELLAEQAGNTLDIVYREPLNVGTIALMNGAVANRAALINAMDTTNGAPVLEKAIRTLNIANAQKLTSVISAGTNVGTKPVRAAFFAICHPYVQNDIEKITGFQHVSEYASQSDIQKSEFGAYKDIRFVSSTNGKMFGDTLTNATAGIYQNPATSKNAAFSVLIFAKSAYGIVPLGPKTIENIVNPPNDPLHQLQTSGWKASTACKILRESMMVRIETCASA